MDIESYRSEFPVTEKYCFLNHAAISPLSRRVVNAVTQLSKEMSLHGAAHYPHWSKRIEEVRGLFARLVGASAEDISFISNTSEGLSIVASGLKWRPGDKVITVQPDFPSNVYPWVNLERCGVELIVVRRRHGRFSVKDVANALRPKVKLITVSSVDFASGHYCDLEGLGDLCRKKGLIFCVDAIQSLGLIPLDVNRFGIHVLAAGGQKWLLGPQGCGGLFVSKEVRELICPAHVGWKSVVDENNFFQIRFELKKEAARFEPGTPNVLGIYALGAAIELLLEIGIDHIKKRVFSLIDQFIEGLRRRGLDIVSPLGQDERSGILCFVPGRDPKDVFSHLFNHGVVISERGGRIRISPHFYNNSSDIDQFFHALDTC